jgi:eukaryotic-like serine/threonine-protein kinase
LSFRERIEWMLRVSLLVFILAATAFLSAVMAMRFAIQGREVDMPNLIGKSLPDAEAIVHGRRLQLKIVDRIYSDLPANMVARQSPPAGEQMKISQDAHVVLSLGPQNVTIPELAGQSLRIARIQLLQAGLQLGEVTSYTGPNTAVDTVLQQNPPAGARATSLSVDLLVAEGAPQQTYVMPYLVGMVEADADHLIISSGLKIPKITAAVSPEAAKGTVTQQIPDAGSKVTVDTPIELVVAQ